MRHGERISFLRATGRYAAKYLSALPCFLGFIAALFSSRRLALHDRLADTRVVRDYSSECISMNPLPCSE